MSDDLMRRLEAARPTHLDPGVRTDAATRGTELATIMAAPREADPAAGAYAGGSGAAPGRAERRRSGRRLPVPALGLAGLVAASGALVVAVTVLPIGGSSGSSGSSGTGGRAGGTGTGATSDIGGDRARPTILPARQVLLAAAHEADRRPAQAGRYWHVRSTSRDLVRAEGQGERYTVISKQGNEQWTVYDPKDVGWATDRYLGAEPLTAADRAAWRRAGSPAEYTIMAPALEQAGKAQPLANGGGKGRKLPAAPGEPFVTVVGPLGATVTWQGKPTTLKELQAKTGGSDRQGAARQERIGVSSPVDGDKIFWLGRNVSMRDLRSLPADPAALKAELLRWYGGHGTESASDKVSSTEWLFDVVRGLILDMPVTPQVRAGAFRMLAGLDDIRVIDGVRTGSGTVGTAVAISKSNPSGVQEERIIFDRATSAGLGDAVVVVKPAGLTEGLAPGTVWISREIEAGWTDTQPTLLK